MTISSSCSSRNSTLESERMTIALLLLLQIFDSDGLHTKSSNPTVALAIEAAVNEKTAMPLRQHTIHFSFEA